MYPELRKRDPFANRRKGLWKIVGELDSYENYSGDGWAITSVYTACRILGSSMGALDFSVFKQDGDRNIDQPNHPVSKLFNGEVNSYMNTFDWFFVSMFHVGMRGNALSAIIRNKKGDPTELVMIDPDKVERVELRNGVKRYEIQKNWFEGEDLFHIMGPSWDGLWGRNPIQAHKDVMGADEHIQTYLRSFFENGAHVKQVILSDGTLDDEEFNNLYSSWNEAMVGPEKTAGTAILEGGMDIKPLSLNPPDAAYLQASSDVRKKVANIYGIPLFLFNEFADGAKYGKVEDQDLTYVKYTISPWVKKFEQEIRRKLLRGKFIPVFDLSSLSRGDMGAQSEFATKFYNMGMLNRNEGRRKYLGLNPVDDGDRFFIQGNNMVPVDKIDDVYDAKLNPSNIPGQGGRPKDDVPDPDLPTIKED